MENIAPTGIRSPDRPARSESRGMEVEEKIKIRGGIEAVRRISDVVSAKSRTFFFCAILESA